MLARCNRSTASAIAFEDGELSIPGYKLGVELRGKNLYPDMV
jgi:hypothetical protein